ncbi:hypothetical protein AAVH_33041, partial [Aphelenchoides avenae]
SICTKKPRQVLGRCAKPPTTVYYFDSDALRCLPYQVIECDAPSTQTHFDNRFSSIKECRFKCETTACSSGETPLFIDDDIDKIQLCGVDGSCPYGHTCRYDKIFHRYVCCGQANFGERL